MVGLICFFIVLPLVICEWEAVWSEVGEQSGVAAHVGSMVLAKDARARQGFFLHFFKKFWGVSTAVRMESGRRSETAGMFSAKGAFSC